MEPNADRLLNNLASYFMMNVAPYMGSDMGMKTVSVGAVLMIATAQEFDRAAARRIEENRQLRNLFSEAAPVVANGELKTRLLEAAVKVESDYRVSALDKGNQELRSLFIDLHSYIETMEGNHARRIEGMIWQEMAEMVRRRAYSIWPPMK